MQTKKLYKYKSLSDIEPVLDIILNKWLYCSDVSKLNDIREGSMSVNPYIQRGIMWNYPDDIQTEVSKFKVCSLSTILHHHLMWAHYADGYKGLVIEVEIDECDFDYVLYSNEAIKCEELKSSNNIEINAKRVLTTKFKDWEYEKEARIIQKQRFFDLKYPISKVIVGPRTSPLIVSVLKSICVKEDIILEKMVISDTGTICIDLDQV